MLSRRLRGFLGVMTTWGVVFSAFGVASFTAVILSGRFPAEIGYRFLPMVALRGFVAGALSGALFAALLVGRKRSQTVSTISMRRATALGFVGGASLPLVTLLAGRTFGLIPVATIITSSVVAGVIGSGIAGSIIWIAQRAPRLPSEPIAPELPHR
jgi:hypothetical protein